MKKEFQLGVIGGGFMGYAIVKGAVESRFIPAERIIVSDVSQANLEKFSLLGCQTVQDNVKAATESEYLLFAVKPQIYPTVAQGLQNVEIEKAISIMAGLAKAKIRNVLPKIKTVCRIMPNLPCSIGSGMVAIDATEWEREDVLFISGLFGALGKYIFVEEGKMHAITGISGSGPAYVFLFLKALIEAGTEQGLSREEAEISAIETVRGGVDMYEHEKSTVDIDTLIQRVCSKGGTTEQAMYSFANDDMIGTVKRAVDACVKRSEELSR